MNPPWTVLASHAVLLKRDDIDTDQIIPARFLTTTTRQGLGKHLFADWRYREDGTPRADFPLHHPGAEGARILVAGHNFGCGSSREHAPWALVDHGFRAVIAGSFADIFRSNAHKNGLLTVALEDEVLDRLHQALEEEEGVHPLVTVDLPDQEVTLPVPGGGVRTVHFSIDPFGKRCLVEGLDELGVLVAEIPAIEGWEAACGR